MKTLDQVEARTPITAGAQGVTANANGGFTLAGNRSYYLTGALTITDGSGLIVSGSRVTVDLNGFDISSTASAASGYGVELGAAVEQVVIRNGVIKSGTVRTGNAYPFSFAPH
jgi:hypothetical protein